MKPNLFIIGAHKAASTFVAVCLGEHPDVYIVPEDVPFFEDPDYSTGDIAGFERLFSAATSEKVIGVKRPSYYARPEVPERIYRQYPDSKLLLILRNPIERAISAYFHQIRSGYLPIENIEEGMRKIIDGEYREIYKRSGEIIEFGFYHKHLMHYRTYFSQEQIHIILFDDIKKDSLGALKDICRFLEISSDFSPESLNTRPQEVIYSIPRLRFLILRNRFLYVYNEDMTRSSLKRQTSVDKALFHLISQVDNVIMKRVFNNDKPKLSTSLKNRLVDIYREDIDSLSGYLERDLEVWKK
jgi:hypothetical protein